MKGLLVQFNLLFTKRIVIYLGVIGVLTVLYAWLTSEVMSTSAYQRFFMTQLQERYYQDMITYLKLMVTVSVIFLLMHAQVSNQYDVLFVGRQDTTVFITTKLIVIMVLLAIVIIIIGSILTAFGLLTEYFDFTVNLLYIFISIFILGVYYLLLGALIYCYMQHILAFMIPLMGYLLAFTMTDPIIESNDLTPLYYWLHFVFPDMLVNSQYKPYYVYGYGAILLLCLSFFMFINSRYTYQVVTHKKH
ncbi:MAG: hypothetical protein UMR38_08005 [Candidatus Izemoplasma sp.]|nr:hypothetical protein [Candidatus Izemoplasma sp.]